MVILTSYAGALLEPNGLANALDKLMKTKLVTKNQKAALRNATAEISPELARKFEQPCEPCGGLIHQTYYKHFRDGWLVEQSRVTGLKLQIAKIREASAGIRRAIYDLENSTRMLYKITETEAIDREIARLQAALEPFVKKERRLNELKKDAELEVIKFELAINNKK